MKKILVIIGAVCVLSGSVSAADTCATGNNWSTGAMASTSELSRAMQDKINERCRALCGQLSALRDYWKKNDGDSRDAAKVRKKVEMESGEENYGVIAFLQKRLSVLAGYNLLPGEIAKCLKDAVASSEGIAQHMLIALLADLTVEKVYMLLAAVTTSSVDDLALPPA